VRPPGPPVPVAAALVSVGGALGALTRWGLGSALPADPESFPWTTFAINVSGALLLALLPATPAGRSRVLAPYLVPLLGPGLLGGYTTLSATSEDARSLLAGGDTLLASAYLLGTLAAALTAVAVAGRLTRAPAPASGGRP
jgi:CrcB protein